MIIWVTQLGGHVKGGGEIYSKQPDNPTEIFCESQLGGAPERH